jgi:hypothetical protein
MISCFDLVALQEVNRDLSALETLMGILGREWDYIATDTTEGSGGNDERMAFVYNTEKVWFRKIAGEVVLASLLSYGVESSDLFRRAATYVDRILRGEKPSEMPVQGPTRFELEGTRARGSVLTSCPRRRFDRMRQTAPSSATTGALITHARPPIKTARPQGRGACRDRAAPCAAPYSSRNALAI